MLSLKVTPYILDFKFSAKTSRGAMTDRKVWFIELTDETGMIGVGEVAPIHRLSPEELDDVPEELDKLKSAIRKIILPKSQNEVFEVVQNLVSLHFPSIRFGLEMALLDLINGGQKKIFRHDLQNVRLPINGLVWMGDKSFMKKQITEKLDQGFSCIKLKVGALDFDTEIGLIRELRNISDDLIIRLDANGAFPVNEVLLKLKTLSRFNIHSIEQPILPMQPEAMQIVCKKSPIPIALDEELIGLNSEQARIEMLQEIRPHYLVLKPTLHGGFGSVKDWIDLAEMHNIEWWMTSYLESNIGLNAIAQFASLYDNEEHHGLGTGGLYHNNIISPIQIEQGYFKYAESLTWGDIDF
jgi:o-succinylbenzoate synthase